jgi:hypothetical protein
MTDTIIRSFRVEIETPEDDTAKTVQYHRHAILKDAQGATLGMALEQPRPIGFRFIDEAATLRTFRDPVQGIDITISIAGIAAAIRADYDARRAEELAAQAEQPTIQGTQEAP